MSGIIKVNDTIKKVESIMDALIRKKISVYHTYHSTIGGYSVLMVSREKTQTYLSVYVNHDKLNQGAKKHA